MSHHRKTSSVGTYVVIACGMVLSVLCGMLIGFSMLTGTVKTEVIVVKQPAVVAPAAPVKKVRDTLAQTRKDWGIEGKLVCHTEEK